MQQGSGGPNQVVGASHLIAKSGSVVSIQVVGKQDNHYKVGKEPDDLELLKPLSEAAKTRFEEPVLAQALSYYVVPGITLSVNSSVNSEHPTSFHHSLFGSGGFLSESNKDRLFFLQGDSGAGKSLGVRYLERCIWDARENRKTFNFENTMIDILKKYVPLLIDLKNLGDKNIANFITSLLKETHNYSDDEIKLLKTRFNFLILLDGYDEMTGALKGTNICSPLLESGWKGKVLLTCRSQYLAQLPNYRSLFSTGFGHNTGSYILERFLAPFTRKQIDSYVTQVTTISQKQKKEGSVVWETGEIESKLNEFPGLVELVSSPLLLKMVVDALPKIIQKLKEDKEKQVTRTLVYQSFVRHWFERECNRLNLIKSKIEFSSELTIASFLDFAQKLAFRMFIKNEKQTITEVQYQDILNTPKRQGRFAEPASSTSAFTEWDEFFGSQDQTIVQKRMACPLRRRTDEANKVDYYSFYHKSFLEYFAASYFYEFDLQLESSEEVFVQVLGVLKDKIDFNKKLLTSEPAIIDFLAEMIQDNLRVVKREEKVDRLFRIVRASISEKAVNIASSNAITVLNRARISFRGKDLNFIQIPGADLSHAMLSHTCLQHANLKNVILRQAFLRQTDLTDANLTGADFGEYPSIKCHSSVNCVAYSKDGQYLAMGVGNTVELWEIIKAGWQKKIATFDEHKDRVNCVDFDKESGLIVSGSGDRTLKLWDANRHELIMTLQGHTKGVTSWLKDLHALEGS